MSVGNTSSKPTWNSKVKIPELTNFGGFSVRSSFLDEVGNRSNKSYAKPLIHLTGRKTIGRCRLW
ncbi:hypothetical protein CH380_10190 [Leptospira adleri]|uniref:Uncharacterized protein n=1 Tax=Leptospira adleri TaxID=2023186 RepID=A0A2M9YPT9_9LEPT|nr:hypothetical protein CH380_10190 [Leptospira adleri]PJZ62208.1 hypothetical protein CH376_09040 [Leptospira adleri]